MSQHSDIVMPEEFREIPIAGSYEEHDFGDGAWRYWLKFTDSRYTEWCGKFGLGTRPGKRKVLWFPNTREFFVLADGQGYVVDSDKRKVLAKTTSDMLEDAVLILNKGLAAVTDGLTIGLFGRTGDIWKSKRITFDGIVFGDVSEDRVTGKLWDLTDDWCDFIFHVDERRIEAEWSYEEAFRPASLSQIRLARIVVMTFGAAVMVLGIALYVSYRELIDLGLTLLGLSCFLAGRFASRKNKASGGASPTLPLTPQHKNL